MNFQKGTAAWRGAVAAAVGAGILVVLVVITNGFNIPLILFALVLGPVYGFGYAFANWHYIIKKTKQGAAEGAAVFGIGLLLSRLTRNSSYGAWGWVYFLIRVAWNLGMGWIPGVWYGVQAIRAETRQRTSRPRPVSPAAPRARVSPPVAQEQRALNRQRIETLKAAMAAQQAVQPSLDCVAGAFAGASFPVQPGEVLCLGSDPTRCQIVLPGTAAAARQCLLQYDSVRGWQARGLPGAKTYINGVQPLGTDAFQPLPAGTILCISQGKNSQRFRIQ